MLAAIHRELGGAVRTEVRCLSALGLSIVLSACTAATVSPRTPESRASRGLRAEPWPEADRLFRQSRRWLGGDAASTIDMGNGKTLWLFGDSFVADRVEGDREQSRMIHNSVGLQTGEDPSRSTLNQYWRTENGAPAAFFSWTEGEWLWPLQGVRIAETLTVFCVRVRADANPLGFLTTGWVALRADRPDRSPLAWSIEALPVPSSPVPILGGVSVLRTNGWIFAYAVHDGQPRDAFLMRWPEALFVRGDLSQPEWWSGSGWVPEGDLSGPPAPVMRNVSAEFSVSEHPRLGFVQVETTGFPVGDLTVRFADRLEGPWTEPRVVYQPPEGGAPGAMVYAGKAHPYLRGADLVATYVASGNDFWAILRDPSRYYPRFVRLFVP
jgi:hypothetical protein